MKFLFAAAALSVIALGVQLFLFPSLPMWGTGILLAIVIVMLALLYRSVVSPMATLATGVDLVREQDFNSRLVKVGQADADRLVDIFNRMMDRIKEERLGKEEKNLFLEQLIEASPSGIVILDFDGKVVRGNPVATRLLGLDAAAAGKHISEFRGEIWQAIMSVKDGKSATVRMSDNHIFRISRLWFVDRGFQRPFIVIDLLTDEMHRAEKEAYGKVIRMIAHEVNNSMAGVKSILETLGEMLGEDENLREILGSCRDRCVDMSRFITSYADVVKLPDPTLLPMELNTFVARHLHFLEGMVPADSGIKIIFEESSEPAEILADEVLLGQVLVNVVKNAIESTVLAGSGAAVTISVASTPQPTLVVTDGGAGVSPEISGKLFTPFFSTKCGGQGIGLMCVSEILTRHGARFSLSTSPADRLTRFTVGFRSKKQEH